MGGDPRHGCRAGPQLPSVLRAQRTPGLDKRGDRAGLLNPAPPRTQSYSFNSPGNQDPGVWGARNLGGAGPTERGPACARLPAASPGWGPGFPLYGAGGLASGQKSSGQDGRSESQGQRVSGAGLEPRGELWGAGCPPRTVPRPLRLCRPPVVTVTVLSGDAGAAPAAPFFLQWRRVLLGLASPSPTRGGLPPRPPRRGRGSVPLICELIVRVTLWEACLFSCYAGDTELPSKLGLFKLIRIVDLKKNIK